MSTFLGIKLNARLRPLDRGDLYEDPLQEILDERMPGSTISGGGTMMGSDGEPTSCDVDIDLAGDPEHGFALIIDVLNGLGAPRGSIATLSGAKPVSFGVSEGLGLYLNGTDLDPDVYANADINELVERLNESLGEAGGMHSYWEGPSETALYFYGSSEGQMRTRMGDVLDAHPLARQSRLVTLT